VDDFVSWANNSWDVLTKDEFYPSLPKDRLFQEGYIATKSSHSRGSAVDVTLVALPVQAQQVYLPGQPLTPCTRAAGLRFGDNTIDMGTGFDCMDAMSNTADSHVTGAPAANRARLVRLMDDFGFDNFPMEWWHFTLRNEPFPTTIFDFPLQKDCSEHFQVAPKLHTPMVNDSLVTPVAATATATSTAKTNSEATASDEWRRSFLPVWLGAAPAQLATEALAVFQRSTAVAALLTPEPILYHRLAAALRAVGATYHPENAYHGPAHALHVLTAAETLLRAAVNTSSAPTRQQPERASSFSPFSPTEQLAFLWAAWIHDADHRGVPNARLVLDAHPLATQFSSQSPAEMQALVLGAEVISRPECAFLPPEVDAAEFRQIVSVCLLLPPFHSILVLFCLVLSCLVLFWRYHYHTESLAAFDFKLSTLLFSSLLFLLLNLLAYRLKTLVLATDIADPDRAVVVNSRLKDGIVKTSGASRLDLGRKEGRLAALTLLLQTADVGASLQSIETGYLWAERYFRESRLEEAFYFHVRTHEHMHTHMPDHPGLSLSPNLTASLLQQRAFLEKHMLAHVQRLSAIEVLQADVIASMWHSALTFLRQWESDGAQRLAEWSGSGRTCMD
jgi:hypothetical protein